MTNDNIKEIRKILTKEYDHYFDNKNDGHHKSAEATVTITCEYPNYFEDEYQFEDPSYWVITVYSYLFGTNRNNKYTGKSLEQASAMALKDVKSWFA